MVKTLKREYREFLLLMRSVPSLVVTFFVLSVVMMNLLANRELFSAKYLALDCGFFFSWISFLCMDMICKHYGAKASAEIAFLAQAVNLIVFLMMSLIMLTSGKWGAFYDTGLLEVNSALNQTFSGSYYVVLGSSVAMLLASLCNASINVAIGRRLRHDNFRGFALRSYISTIIAQFVDNFIFAVLVSRVFFGWNWVQIIVCSCTGALMELLFEVLLSPLGYKIVVNWQKNAVGQSYLQAVQK